jgi:UDP-glucose 4-epimerase
MINRSGPVAGACFLIVGCGFIGTHFVRRLLAQGAKTRVLTRSAPDAETCSALGDDLVIGDAGDATVVEAVLQGVTHVVYSAGGLMPAESNRDPAVDAALTFAPLVTVLRSLRRRGVSFTFISSGGTVYGEPQNLPVDENHPTDPISAYGTVKLAAEKLVMMHARQNALSARILRCSNVYGEDQPANRGQGAVATFTARLLDGKPVIIYGDGRIVRDYVYIGDVVTAALALVERPRLPVILNVGSGHGHSLNEVIATIEEVSEERLTVEHRPARDFDVSEIVLDISRLRSLVDYEAAPLNEGIGRVLAHGLAAVGKPRTATL